MSKRKSSTAITWVGVSCLVVVVAAAGYYVQQRWGRREAEPTMPADVQMVVDEMLNAWDGVQAVSANVETFMPKALGQPGTTNGSGTYDLLKKNGKVLIRFDVVNTMKLDIADDPEHTQYYAGERLRWVVDGDVIYHWFQQPDFKKAGEVVERATKEPYSPDKIVQIGGQPLFDQLRHDFDLRRLPDIDYEGRPVYVLRGDAHGANWHSLHYFDKESGIRVRMVENEADGSASLRILLKHLDLAPEFGPDHFTFTPPKGAKLEDNKQEAP